MNATDKLDGLVISEGAKGWLNTLRGFSNVVAPSPDVVVCVTNRSEYGGSGGIGYFDSVRVYYHGQTQMKEWQWRDRWSASNDRPWLSIHEIGKIDVSVSEGKATVTVEVKNRDPRGNRSAVFTFEHKEETTVQTLSESDQQAFTAKVDAEMDRIMAHLNKMWKLKPTMLDLRGNYAAYYQPKVKEQIVRANIGLAVFVTEEQIDARDGHRQMRYELYVMTSEDTQSRRLAEDHAYEPREGSGVIAIVDVNRDKITINTRHGQRELAVR